MTGNPASWLFRRMPRVLLIGGLLAVSIYYGIAVQRGAGGHPASPQTDAFSFMQYARAIAEGHPYAYATGDAPSTGSTSHLYPVVLAIPYLLGARGDALLTATFVLNALFYLIWLQIFWRVARRVAPGQAVLAAGLALLNGHILMTVAGLTDMALFTTLAWGLFAALLYERTRLAALLLVFCVFARPEGMLLAVGLAGMGAFLAWRRDPGARRMVGIAACGMAALFAVFALNQALTGFAQFQSVATKGYLRRARLRHADARTSLQRRRGAASGLFSARGRRAPRRGRDGRDLPSGREGAACPVVAPRQSGGARPDRAERMAGVVHRPLFSVDSAHLVPAGSPRRRTGGTDVPQSAIFSGARRFVARL
jgi:hypothetical protein